MAEAPPGLVSPPSLAIDPSLRARFCAAGDAIVWRDAPDAGSGGRIAHLHDEEARIERRRADAGEQIWVDAGPVGALLLLLAIEAAAAPATLESRGPADAPGFPGGALVARWDGAVGRPDAPRLSDLVALARYALA